MTDVRLRHEPDGGNIESINGRITLSDGLENAVYASLFGGNERDAGTDATSALEWWGNKLESASSRKLRSRTQYLITKLPLVPANLLRFEDAASADLAWLKSIGVASFVGVTASIPALNTLSLAARIEVNDQVYDFAFTRSAAARVNS